MRIDILTLLGVILALAAVFIGQYLDGGHFNMLFNMPALIIVLGGTLGAVLVETPMPIFQRAMIMSRLVFRFHDNNYRLLSAKLVEWSKIARREGLISLDSIMLREKDLFLKKGLQLLIDGTEPEVIRSVLGLEIDSKEQNDLEAAQVFGSMGGYSPTLGIIGAVLGLIHVMGNLNEPALLGSGIAVAFVATVYGVGFANIFFIPFGNKLKHIIQEEVVYRSILVEGIVAIAEGENPKLIKLKLDSFLS